MNEPVDQTTHEKIVSAAAEVFAEQGYDAASVREITTRAEVNLGAITYHFGGKRELFSAVLERKVAPLRAMLREVADSEMSAREKLREIALRGNLYILHHDPSMKVFFVECIQGGMRLPETAVTTITERNRIVSGIIQSGIDCGEFRPCDVESATWIFFGLLMPYVIHEPLAKPGGQRGPYDEKFVRDIVDTAMDLFLKGLEQ